MPNYSFIIPVYNRPEELQENLESLRNLDFKDFEVIIIEDGSSVKSDKIVEQHKDNLSITYHFKHNEGPSIGRNVGASLAQGKYLIFVDSDCIMPPDYLTTITTELKEDTDVFGGPDRAHESFTSLQKAINFSMTSLITTGGIRGRKKSVDRYYPRSFNLGIRRSVFQEMGGFPKTKMHPGEDMVFGIELIKRGYKTQYIHDAFVYHKRRTNIKQFYNQIRKFGKVRFYITKMYPDTFKITYLLPVAFTLFAVGAVITALLGWMLPIYVLGVYSVLLFIMATIESKSIITGAQSILTSYIQFFAYAKGITSSFWTLGIQGQDEYDVIGKDLFKNV